jgi:tRNA A-37 threonylcarbamoyl transferase component Bud32
MTPLDRKARTTTLFHEALAKPAAQRLHYLREASAGDAALFDKVSELLEAYAEVETAVPWDGGDDTPNLALQSIDALLDLSDRYKEIKFIGEGGMGIVYRAYDQEIGKVVALKTLHPRFAADARIVERLRKETRLALDITHRNVCRIYGLERINGRPLIAMEYVDGETLRCILDRARGVSVPQGLVWASEVCEALAAAHEKNIVHRDLKPENIMLDREGHVKVMDFGIACSLQADGDQTAGNPGTPSYMSPEQRDRRPVGPTSDIYSLGLVFYELFTGVRRDPGSVIPPASLNPYLPSHVSEAIGKCLEPDPRDRFQTMLELKIALTHDYQVGGGGQLRRGAVRRFSTPALVVALCGLLGVMGLVAYLLVPSPARGHEDKVNAIAFSPDGRILASGGEDRTIILWDAATLHRIRTLTDHVRAVTSLAFSGDSRWLASGGGDTTIQIANVATARVRATLPDTKETQALALSPDGRWLASSADESIKVWDVLAGRVVRKMSHDDEVHELAFSADGRLLASASTDSTVGVWEVETGRRLSGALRHDDVVDAVAFSPDGRLLASASLDKTIKLWSTATWGIVQTLWQGERVSYVSFSSDGKLLLSISERGKIKIWRSPTWSMVATLASKRADRASTWAFSPDARTLAIGTNDGKVLLQRLQLPPNQ